jgi:TnpA family transposase
MEEQRMKGGKMLRANKLTQQEIAQQLYRPASLKVETLPLLSPHLAHILNEERIRYHWNDMPRYALSLKKGYGTASLLIQKLQAYPREHPMSKVLQEFGRLEKMLHILRWYEGIYTRKRISRQLNKGEALHYLRSHLLFGKHGEIEGLEDEPLDLQAACLNLVTNAIIIFNTVHMTKAVDDLRREGHNIRADDLARSGQAALAISIFLESITLMLTTFDQGSISNLPWSLPPEIS